MVYRPIARGDLVEIGDYRCAGVDSTRDEVAERAELVFVRSGLFRIESERAGTITLRSAVELLSAAFALHPAFAEAEILETGAACRPAFADNLPRVTRQGPVVTFAGLYRHGFLLAPALSARAVEEVQSFLEAA